MLIAALNYGKKMSLEEEYIEYPPITDRLCEGSRETSIWLISYLNFRLKDDSTQQQAKDYLDQIGQNSSLFSSRFRGAFLGMALGDSFGVTLDSNVQNSPSIITEIAKNCLNFKIWRGGTSMALCLAHSLIRKKCFRKKDQLNLYMQWREYGAFSLNREKTERIFGMSDAAIEALKNYEVTKDLDPGDPNPSATGSEPLMKIAPVVLFFFGNVKDCISASGGSSMSTHRSAKAISSCMYFGALLFGAIRGYPKKELTEGFFEPSDVFFEPDSGVWEGHKLDAEVINIVKTAHLKTRNEIKLDGYIVHTLEAAIWVFHNTSSFEDGMLLVASLPGSNKNAVASVYGQLAGAFYGEHNIDPEWIKSLPWYHVFYYYAEKLLRYGVSDAPRLFLGENTNLMP